MTRRELALSTAARLDIARHACVLEQARDSAFAEAWVRDLTSWLRRQAESGVVIGTEHPHRAGLRTFGYKRQATLLVRYAKAEVQVVRVYFAGQDWMR